MEFWNMFQEVVMGIMSTVGVIIAIICRSAKPKTPEKQAKWEEETKKKAREQKEARLFKLRKEDEEHETALRKNLAEEVELEKELNYGKNA